MRVIIVMNGDSLLNDRYEIKKVLGRGGFATTYLAVDTETQQRCAIKCLSFRKIEEWKTWELFDREAKILKALDHPQIPKYIDFFSVERDEDIELYLVQEYVEGKSLVQLVKEGKHFNEQDVIEIGLEITRVLEYLHSLSPPIIHRDIKPSNIILTPCPSRERAGVSLVYLIDFGAVREKIIADYTTIGGGSTIVGTYGYMPPEQFQARALPATDLYSLGVTLIYLLSRKEPIDIESKGMALNFRPHVNISGSFAAVIEKMTTPDYAKRYQTALRLRKDLEKLSAGKRIVNTQKLSKFLILPTLAMIVIGIVTVIAFFGVREKTRVVEKIVEKEVPGQSKTVEIVSAEAPKQPQTTNIKELNTVDVLKSKALFLSRDELGALLMTVKAGKSIKSAEVPAKLRNQVIVNLREVVYNIYEKNRLETHESDVRSLDFSPDGTMLASGSLDATIKLWNVSDRREIATLQGHSGPVYGLRFGADGKVLTSGSQDNTIRTWNLDLDDLLVRGCKWLHGYLKNNPNVSEEDRALCDDILKNYKD